MMTLTGLDWDLPLKIGCPFEVLLIGNARMLGIEYHTGPPPNPPE